MSISSKLTESKTKLETALSEINDALEEKGGEAVETVYDAADEIRNISGDSEPEITSPNGSSSSLSMKLSNGSWFMPRYQNTHGKLRSDASTDIVINPTKCGRIRYVVKVKRIGETSNWLRCVGPYSPVCLPLIGINPTTHGIYAQLQNTDADWPSVYAENVSLQLNTWYYVCLELIDISLYVFVYDENGTLLGSGHTDILSKRNEASNIVLGGSNEPAGYTSTAEINLSETFVEVDNSVVWGKITPKTADMGKVDPEEYFADYFQKVEYIEFTGTQYINTGIRIKSGDAVYFTADPTDGSTGVSGIGSDWSRGHTMFDFRDNKCELAYKNVGDFVTAPLGKHNYFIDYHLGKVGYDNSATDITVPSSSEFSNQEFIIGAFRENGTNYYPLVGKVYGFQYKNNGNLICDFVPCYRKSDGVTGLYDRVNYMFYTNNGTGTFIKGEDVD